MKRYLAFGAIPILLLVLAMAFVKKEHGEADKHMEIVLRNIGHRILLYSKDSTSRVLPVNAVDDNTFQISFENSFEFMPDTLMRLVHQELAKTDRSGKYSVSVKECSKNRTVFAYEVNSVNGDLRPCKGRMQKTGCYVVEISFPGKKRSFDYAWLLFLIIPAAFAGVYYAGKNRNVSNNQPLTNGAGDDSKSAGDDPVQPAADNIKLGNYSFSVSKRKLSLNGEEVELASKEAKALSLLAANQNKLVEREVLMKEIWEDDGVIVISRNVDVLMSKLRKRLSGDESLKIVSVQGKGYKLVV